VLASIVPARSNVALRLLRWAVWSIGNTSIGRRTWLPVCCRRGRR
jgi:hypothetical protein